MLLHTLAGDVCVCGEAEFVQRTWTRIGEHDFTEGLDENITLPYSKKDLRGKLCQPSGQGSSGLGAGFSGSERPLIFLQIESALKLLQSFTPTFKRLSSSHNHTPSWRS